MRWKTIAITCLGLAAMSAGAQVHRCKDATGKLMFSDRPCDVGQTGGQIMRQRSEDEIYQERMNAAEAQERKQLRREMEAEQAARQAPPPPSVAPVQSAQSVNPFQCRKAKEELDLAMSLRTLSPEEKRIRVNGEQAKVAAACGTPPPEKLAAPAPAAKKAPPPFGNITRCEPGFCFDIHGRPYPRNGQDFLVAPDGRACHRAGPNWICP